MNTTKRSNNTTPDLSAIMRRAWQIRRETAQQHGVEVKEVLMFACMQQAWQESRSKQSDNTQKIEKPYDHVFQIGDLFNPEKTWCVAIKKNPTRTTYYLNQKINGRYFYRKFQQVSVQRLKELHFDSLIHCTSPPKKAA